MKLALPQRCCLLGDTSLSLMYPGSRQIPSWFARVVVSYASLGDLSHLVANGFRFQLMSWPRRYSASGRWQIRGIPIGGVMSSAAVAVVLGAAELVWLDQQQKHWELGFHFQGRPVRNCISWKRCVDDVVVGSRVFCCSCIFVFLRACFRYQTRWYREQVRLSTH